MSTMVKPSTITLSSRVPADANGEALIDYLARRFRYHDRAAWRLVLEAGRVHLDDVQARTVLLKRCAFIEGPNAGIDIDIVFNFPYRFYKIHSSMARCK